MPWIILLFWAWGGIYPKPPTLLFGEKAAYKAHYRGMLYYGEGRHRKAEEQFRQAYRFDQGNHNFALAYGLSLGRAGKTRDAVALLQQVQRNINVADAEAAEKRAVALFFQGASHLYGKQPGRAIEPLQAGIQVLEGRPLPELRSLMLNALGCAIVMYQGTGQHKRAGLPMHSHVHRRALERAFPYFVQALEHDPENRSAFQNFQVLADSLDLHPRPEISPNPSAKAAVASGSSLSLHSALFQDLGLFRYDELLFLVDISGSMVMEKVICLGATRFDVMKDMAQKMLGDIPGHTALGIGTIGGDCGTTPKLWKQVGSMNKAELREDLRFLIPDGTTPLLTILKASASLFTDNKQSGKSIFLISDGANTCREPGMDICAWADSISRQNIAVNVLTFLSTTSMNTEAFAEYLCLAEHTGGHIIYIDNYRCKLERLALDLVKTCAFTLPALQRSTCWGPSVKDLWMITE